jgi:hypothetical protein
VRIKLIACEVLFREICLCASRAKAVIDLTFLRRGLHSNPDMLRQEVQAHIDAVAAASEPPTPRSSGRARAGFSLFPDEEQCQAVVLAYGLCSNGVAGLRARDIPLVVPRAHDCITFLLGSKEEYGRLFSQRPGTYYYSGGWIERRLDRVPRTPEDGAGLDLPFDELVAKYGRDNAEYLWEIQSNWVKHYTHAAHICMQLGDEEGYRDYVRRVAEEHGWNYDEITGNLSLLQALCDGEWDEERFLVVPPGQQIVATVGPDVIAARPPDW